MSFLELLKRTCTIRRIYSFGRNIFGEGINRYGTHQTGIPCFFELIGSAELKEYGVSGRVGTANYLFIFPFGVDIKINDKIYVETEEQIDISSSSSSFINSSSSSESSNHTESESSHSSLSSSSISSLSFSSSSSSTDNDVSSLEHSSYSTFYSSYSNSSSQSSSSTVNSATSSSSSSSEFDETGSCYKVIHVRDAVGRKHHKEVVTEFIEEIFQGVEDIEYDEESVEWSSYESSSSSS